MADRTAWRNIEHRLQNASKEMAAEIGKSLAKAVTQEIMALVKARVGDHAGEGIAAFFKTLRQDTTNDLRRDLQSRSDTNVVKLLARLCDEVAAALDRDVVLAIDECQRLTDDDQRALASLSLTPPKRARFVIAWSSAAHEARDGLTRLRETNCGEVIVGGLSSADVGSMLARAGLAAGHAERVYFLSDGFPIIVEGLISQLRSGGTLENVSFGEFLEAGQRCGELEESSEVLAVALVADGQSAVAGEPGQGAFDLPPVTAEALAAVDAAAGDPRNDAPCPQPPAVYGIVVTLVRPDPAGFAAARTAR